MKPKPPKLTLQNTDVLRHDASVAVIVEDRNLRRAEAGEESPENLDLLAWGRRFLPNHFRRQPSQMHRWLSEQLQTFRDKRGCRLNVIGPRGGAKSTLGSLAFILRTALEKAEPYIWLVSDTKSQAVTHLNNLKMELTANRLLAEEYPTAVGEGPVWRSAAILLNNGVLIEAFGTGQSIRGRRFGAIRPTLIVGDDLQNDSHILSALQREQSSSWFNGTLLPAGNKRTNVLHLATALHRDALALRLHATPGWRSHIFQAIVQWPTNMSLWQEWESVYASPDRDNSQHNDAKEIARAFYEDNQTAMDAGAEVLWPDEEDLYTLMCLRAESGRTAFEREKQSSPLDPNACEWPEEYFAEHIWFDEWPSGLQLRVIALDPSKGTDARRGDYSAFVLLGLAENGVFFVDADLARRPTPQIVADGVELCRTFQPQAFGVEVNQFQELLVGEFTAEFQRQGMHDLNPWNIDNRVNKRVRIRRLGPLLSTKRLRFKTHSPGVRLLLEQMRDFPASDHDDGPDALEMAVRLVAEMMNDE